MKKKVTVQLGNETIERMRDIVYWTPGLTVNEFFEVAIEERIKRLESFRSYEPRQSELKPGPKV